MHALRNPPQNAAQARITVKGNVEAHVCGRLEIGPKDGARCQDDAISTCVFR
jgi:hypothetical protein